MTSQISEENRLTKEIFKLREKISKLENQLQELKVDERKVQESGERFRTLFDTMSLGVVFQDNNGTIISANPAAEKILGLTRDQMLGRTSIDPRWHTIHEDGTPFPGEQHPAMVALRTGEKVSDVIMGIFNPEKKEYSWILVEAIPLFLPGEKTPYQVCATFNDINEIRKAEAALKKSEEKYHNLYDTGLVGLYQTRIKDGQVIAANKAVAKIFGYDSVEQFKSEFKASEHYADPDERKRLVKLSKEKNKIECVEITGTKKDGSIVPLEISSVTYPEEGIFEGVIIDISAKKAALDTFQKSEEKYRLLVENQTDLIIKVDKDGKFLYASDSYCKLFGKVNDELIGKKFEPEVHKDDLKRTWKVLETLYKPPNTSYVENRMLTTDGWKWIAWVNKAFFNKDNELVAVLGAGRDITERKQAEEALIESRKMLQLVLDTIPVRVFWKNRNCEFLGCNQLFAEDAGLQTTEEIIGKNDFELSWKEQAELYRGDDFEVMKTGIPKFNFEEPQTGPGGKHLLLRTSKAPLRDKENVIVGVLGTYEDITEQKSLEEQFRQAQKMEAVGRLAGGIAHDFNNLLTAIKGYSQLLLADLDKALPQYQDIEEINKAANRAAQLTHQLLTFSRKQVIQPQIIDVNDSITNMKKMLFRLIGEDIMLVASLNASNSVIKIDPSQIEQIIMNLSVNARDAMQHGGKLTIETKNVTFSSNKEGIKPGVYLQIEVIDTGAGMSEDVKRHLFEPFFTTKETGKGTGLGLATVYGIVNQNAGYINVTSEQNCGTTFKILFPIPEEKTELLRQEASNEQSFFGVETVLIVEDEAIVCDLAVRVLEKYGYCVMAARQVDEAIKLVTKCERPIHLLVTDVVMPKMNGAELAVHLNKILPEMKVLFISGYTDETIIHHGVLDGEVNFLQKPFTPEQLIKKIRQILDVDTETR